MSAGQPLRFSKMHGAGNHFVVLDRRGGLPAPTPALLRALGDPHTGIGFDQLLTIEDAPRPGIVARYGIYNRDGSTAGQCGNGARCVAAWLQRDGAARGDRFLLDSPAGEIAVERDVIAALASGHLAGAYLDVFEHEPLDPASPLWDMPNVLVSPHTASHSLGQNEAIFGIFLDNLARWRGGGKLRNDVDDLG